jgi:hypothetical protein
MAHSTALRTFVQAPICATPVVPVAVRWLDLPAIGRTGTVMLKKGREPEAGYLSEEFACSYGRAWWVRKAGEREAYHLCLDARSGFLSCSCASGSFRGDGRCKHAHGITALLAIEAERDTVLAADQPPAVKVAPKAVPADAHDLRCEWCGCECDVIGDRFCTMTCCDLFHEQLDAEMWSADTVDPFR